MKKFKCIVTRTDEYVIEIDENVINEEWMEDYQRWFAPYDTYEEHAENIAQYRSRFGGNFVEGYGIVKINGQICSTDNKNVNDIPINIVIKSEDNDCEVEIEEII